MAEFLNPVRLWRDLRTVARQKAMDALLGFERWVRDRWLRDD